MTQINNVLRVSSSGRRQGSVSRALGDELLQAIAVAGTIELLERDLSNGVSHVSENWINANFTDEEARTDEHRDALRVSDELVAELQRADTVIIEMPIYNFGVPAALKAWIDMVARARLTFRYSDNGPVGLLTNKKAYLVVASGGTGIDSEIDFATPYMRHALGFLGITDVETISAGQQMVRGDEAFVGAQKQIRELQTILASRTGKAA